MAAAPMPQGAPPPGAALPPPPVVPPPMVAPGPPPKKPVGVYVIGILWLVFGVFTILNALTTISGTLPGIPSELQDQLADVFAIAALVGFVALILAVLQVILAIGLMAFRNWARVGAIIVAILGFIVTAVTVWLLLPAYLDPATSVFPLLLSLLVIIVNIAIAAYLSSDGVSEAFL